MSEQSSELLWNLIHDEIADAMRMEKQPHPENPMLGELTAVKRTLRLFNSMKALGYDVVVPVLESVKPVASVIVSPTEGRVGIVETIIGAPKVVFKSAAEKIGDGLKAVFHKVVGEEQKQAEG